MEVKVSEEIERFSYLYLSKEEIAIIMQTTVEKLEDPITPEGIAFLTGRLKRKAKFNESLTRLTDQLSSPAMAIEHKLAETTKINDNKRR